MEIPRPPESLVKRLKDHDSRLDIQFNVDEGLWQVVEMLKSGKPSHCFYWSKGPWHAREYMPLPATAEPLLAKLGAMDLARSGQSLPQKIAHLREIGASRRADLALKANQVFRQRANEYIAWTQRNWDRLNGRYRRGGAARESAVKARTDAYREIMNDGKDLGDGVSQPGII